MKRIIISLTFLLYIINTSVAQYNDPKWEFGGEAGFAWVGLTKSESGIFIKTRQTTKRGNMVGFRVFASAKYNLIGRVQVLGGIGFVKAKGENENSGTTENMLFGGTTSLDEKIKQKYTLLEIPTYFRFYLLNERRSTSKNLNIFLDQGTSLKIPINSDLYFTKSRSQSLNYEGALQVKSFFGSYWAIGISIKSKTTIAFTSSRIRSKSKAYNQIKYRSSLNSISLTFFL